MFAQTGAIQGSCDLGGAKALLSGMASTNYQQGNVPSCTITVYLTGTASLATIYADGSSTPLSNPFTATTAASAKPGSWIFWAAYNQGYDVVASGGISPNTYPSPVTLCTDCFPNQQFAVIGAFCPLSGCTLTGPLNGTSAAFSSSFTAPIAVPNSTSVQTFNAKLSEQPSVKDYGAKGDMRVVGTCSVTSGSSTVTCTGMNYTSADVGKVSSLWGCGTGSLASPFHATIVSVTDSTHAVLSANAPSTAGTCQGLTATDDAAAIQAAINAVMAAGNVNQIQGSPAAGLLVPKGTYYLGSTVTTCVSPCTGGAVNVGLKMAGQGRGNTVFFTDQAIDIFDLFTENASSEVSGIYFVGSNNPVGIRVRGNGQKVTGNWFLAAPGVVIETTATIATSAVQLDGNLCDGGGTAGSTGPNCILVERTGGTDPSPNTISISNTQVYSENYGVNIQNGHGMVVANTQCINIPAGTNGCIKVASGGATDVSISGTTAECGSNVSTYVINAALASANNVSILNTSTPANADANGCSGSIIDGTTYVNGVPNVMAGAYRGAFSLPQLTIGSNASDSGNGAAAVLGLRNIFSGTKYFGYVGSSYEGASLPNSGPAFTGMAFQPPRDLAGYGFSFFTKGGTLLRLLDTATATDTLYGWQKISASSPGTAPNPQLQISSLSTDSGFGGNVIVDLTTPFSGTSYHGYIGSSYEGGALPSGPAINGMAFQLPRDVSTFGYRWLNHAGTQLAFIDSVSGNLTIAGVYQVGGTQIALTNLSDGNTALRNCGTFTTTAATSNTFSCSWVTTSSNCQLQASNATAATNIATTYVSAKSSGSITVTHTATSGLTYDVACSAN